MPYEFFSPFNQEKSVDLTQDGVPAFLGEFVKAAKYSSIDGIVALKMFPGMGFRGLEFSEGRANIILKTGQVSHQSIFEEFLFLLPLLSLKLTYRCSTNSRIRQPPKSLGISSEGGWEQKNYCRCTKYFTDHFHTVSQCYPREEAGRPASLK